MDKGLISFLCYVSGLLTIGISITIPSLKLWHNTRLICVLRTQMHTHVHANTPTRLRTRSQTLIALSHCPNKKITNKPHCLFPQRISIRHKSAYAHRQTDTRVNIYKQRTQGSGASFHRDGKKNGLKQGWMTLTLIPPVSNSFWVTLLLHFQALIPLSLISSYLSGTSLQPSGFPIPMPVDTAGCWKKRGFPFSLKSSSLFTKQGTTYFRCDWGY